MSVLRLGYTESTLLAYYIIDKYGNESRIDKNSYKDNQQMMLNWLYSTSGFYDKTIKGSYMNFPRSIIIDTEVYNNYFDELLKLVKNSSYSLTISFHSFLREKEKNFCLTYINYSKKPDIKLHSFMGNRDILIVNNLESLMKEQFYSGNINKVNPDFPNNVKSIQALNTKSTIVNDGPDENILETSKKICEKIGQYHFDACIVSAGAYSLLLSNFIINVLQKNVYVIGGDLPRYFGISTKRIRDINAGVINEYFINVPREMLPKNYKLVEDGCYW